jgi:hydrogenase nickel incorporation protein HypA/HybF
MHELHLAQDVLHKIIEKGTKGSGTEGKLSYIKVVLGANRFTHLEELKELLTDIAKGTIAEVAKIDFEIVPVKAACGACHADFNPKELRLDCPKCGSTDIQMVGGNELRVEIS